MSRSRYLPGAVLLGGAVRFAGLGCGQGALGDGATSSGGTAVADATAPAEPDLSSAEPVVSAGAVQWFFSRQGNPFAFDKKYKGKVVELQSTPIVIRLDEATGRPVVQIATKGDMTPFVDGHFAKQHEDAVAGMAARQIITVRGEYVGAEGGVLVLRHCAPIAADPEDLAPAESEAKRALDEERRRFFERQEQTPGAKKKTGQ